MNEQRSSGNERIVLSCQPSGESKGLKTGLGVGVLIMVGYVTFFGTDGLFTDPQGKSAAFSPQKDGCSVPLDDAKLLKDGDKYVLTVPMPREKAETCPTISVGNAGNGKPLATTLTR